MTDRHEPTNWFWEAGSDSCPHRPRPANDSPDWDAWFERHTGSPQDVFICLDAPAGEACEPCSDESGDMVPWSRCRNRKHVRAYQPTEPRQHRPVTVDVASLECLGRECEEFFTEGGDEIPGKTSCSHVREMEICEACSEPPPGDADPYPAVVAWADCTHAKAEAVTS
ncbi:hypothetical protein ACWGNN_00715 [Streptomyces sp. NPDC055817]